MSIEEDSTQLMRSCQCCRPNFRSPSATSSCFAPAPPCFPLPITTVCVLAGPGAVSRAGAARAGQGLGPPSGRPAAAPLRAVIGRHDGHAEVGVTRDVICLLALPPGPHPARDSDVSSFHSAAESNPSTIRIENVALVGIGVIIAGVVNWEELLGGFTIL